ncbi:hypothetical protein F5146DRAFT_1124101 [Armillaria mellea]|nr:hypothetical protein F5146DRAFT_1124101 [Armillaria mellea]
MFTIFTSPSFNIALIIRFTKDPASKYSFKYDIHDHLPGLKHVLPSSLVTDLRDGIQISTEAHAESMRQTLAGLIPKLDKYDAEIKELEETLEYLKHRRTELAHSVTVYKAYLAPIRRLPVELLWQNFPGGERYRIPYRLSLLLLAKRIPLFTPTLTIFSLSPSLLNLNTCRSFIFDVCLASSSNLVLPSPGFVSLERLDLLGYVEDDMSNATALSLFHDAPRLRELHLHDTWSGTLEYVGIDCSAIRTLWFEEHESDPQWDDIVRILDSFPSLDVLVFYRGWFQNITATVTIPGVKVLQICAEQGTPARLLDVLTLPDLCRLEIFDDEKSDGPNITAPEEIDVIVASLARSPVFNKLRFDKAAIRGVDLIRILENVPKLTKLALVDCRSYYTSITDELLDRMMDADFLPKLEDLEMVWGEENEIEEGEVLNVIERRCGRLRSVIVGFPFLNRVEDHDGSSAFSFWHGRGTLDIPEFYDTRAKTWDTIRGHGPGH